YRRRSNGRVEGRSRRGGQQLPVQYVETDIHRRGEVVLGARTERPDAPVGVAASDVAEDAATGDRTRRSALGGQREILLGADRRVGITVVVNLQIRSVDGGPESLRPEVVVGGVNTPGSRQPDVTGSGAVDAIRPEAVAERCPVEIGGVVALGAVTSGL